MEPYPRSLVEFNEWFNTEEACVAYLSALRWPTGFVCPKCGRQDAWRTGRGLWHCRGCSTQTSVTAGTIFHRTRKPLRLWFMAMWQVSGQKYGANALGLQRALGLGGYQTAWEWLHKLRRAMVRPGRDRLGGAVQMDETYVGGKKPGKAGRGAAGKTVVGIAVEDRPPNGIGRIRLQCLPDASGDSLKAFAATCVEPGTRVATDDWSGYSGFTAAGYPRSIVSPDELKLPHLIASLLKRWLLGTYQGAVRPPQLPYYLDEFTFRFNRRSSHSRGKLFYRLAQQAVMTDPAPRSTLVAALPSTEDDDLDDLNHNM